MPRRGESVYKRSDGRWEARYIHHYENGKAKYRYLYAPTYAGVKAKRAAEQCMPQYAHISTYKQTAQFGEVAALWLADIKEHVKESTYARYDRVVSSYLNPYFEEKTITQLDIHFCRTVLKKLSEHGGKYGAPLSDKTVSDVLCICKSIFSYGKKHDYPCADLSELSWCMKKKKSFCILTEKNRRTIEDAFLHSDPNDFDYRVRFGILFALYTGVRIGELCGIRYEDIDMEENTIHICRTVERISETGNAIERKTKLIITTPKTYSSARFIPLPLFLIPYIKKSRNHAECYLLTGMPTPTEPHQFYMRYKTFMRNHGMDGYTFHALRHTFATRCIEEGVDAKSLSEILGHANVTTTLALYVHPTMDQKRRQMEKLTPLCEL